MTYFPATVVGRWFQPLPDTGSLQPQGRGLGDSSDHAVHLVRRTALAEGIAALTDKPVLHGGNGSTLKAATVLAMHNWLDVKPSYSRPLFCVAAVQISGPTFGSLPFPASDLVPLPPGIDRIRP